MTPQDRGPTDAGKQPDAYLIDRYCAGQAIAEERTALEALFHENPQDQRKVENIRTAVLREEMAPFTAGEIAGMTAAILGAASGPVGIDSTQHAARHAARPKRFVRQMVGHMFGRIAAVLVLGVTSAFVWRYAHARPTPSSASNHQTAVREIATRRGQRAELRLADGTRVVLGPDSRLKVPVNEERDLQLEGEAYFEVVHDTARPFRVRTATGIAEDLGTTFVVSAYPEARGMSVAVTSGAVALHRRTPALDGSRAGDNPRDTLPAVTLTPGDLGRLDAMGNGTVTRHADLAPYVGWAEGRLVLRRTTFADAIPRLERWYDLHIELADNALGREPLVATFEHDTDAEVLRRLALATNTRIEQHGRVVRFFRR